MLFLPADEDDLAAFLEGLDPAVPVTSLGVGSNILVRDGGVEGVVIRLGRRASPRSSRAADSRIFAGAGGAGRHRGARGGQGRDRRAGVLRAACPGTIGGALTMNAGCYGVGDQGRAGRGLGA